MKTPILKESEWIKSKINGDSSLSAVDLIQMHQYTNQYLSEMIKYQEWIKSRILTTINTLEIFERFAKENNVPIIIKKK